MFRNRIHFYGQELLASRPTPQAGGPPLVVCPRLLTQYIRSYLPYWWPFLHPQPEDAPCRGDRDPLITDLVCDRFQKYFRYNVDPSVFYTPLVNGFSLTLCLTGFIRELPLLSESSSLQVHIFQEQPHIILLLLDTLF